MPACEMGLTPLLKRHTLSALMLPHCPLLTHRNAGNTPRSNWAENVSGRRQKDKQTNNQSISGPVAVRRRKDLTQTADPILSPVTSVQTV